MLSGTGTTDLSAFLPHGAPAPSGAAPGSTGLSFAPITPVGAAASLLSPLGPLTQIQAPTNSGGGLLGFLGNAWHDITAVPTGVANLAFGALGELVHHPVDVAEEVGSLGIVNKPDVNFLTPRFVYDIPIGFVKNAKNYYFSRDLPSHLFQHPLQPVLDAATVAGGVGVAGRLAVATGTTAAALGEEAAVAASAEAGVAAAAEAGAPEAAAAAEAAIPVATDAAAAAVPTLPPAGGMAGALGRFAAARSPGLAEWMAANAKTLAETRAANIAREGVAGALESGEQVRTAAGAADATGIVSSPVSPLAGDTGILPTARAGFKAIGETVNQWAQASPQTRWAQFLDISNPEPLRIANPDTGTVFGGQHGIQPGYNPMLRALWSDPLRSKLLSETVPEWSARVLRPLQDAAAEAEATGVPLPAEMQAELGQAEASAARMNAEGAQLVAKKTYAGAMYTKAQMTQSITNMLAHYGVRGMASHREMAADLGAVGHGLSDAGVLPDDVATRLHLYLEGLDTGVGTTFAPEELAPMLAAKGWATPEDAARDLIHQTGNYQALSLDEQNSVLRMVKDEQIPMPDLWRYQPEPDLINIPERAAFEQQFRDTANASGLSQNHQDLMMAVYDSTAKAIEREHGQSVAETYANMHMRFEPEHTPVDPTELYQSLDPAASRRSVASIAPGADTEKLITRIQNGLNDHIPADRIPYSRDDAANILWDRTRQIVQDEATRVEKEMRTLPLTQRRKLGSYLERLNAVATGDSLDPEAWAALKRTKFGKYLTDRVTTELNSMELPQRIGSEIRGATMFGPEFKTLTRIFSTGDFTTYMHEFGHVLRRMLPEDTQQVLRDVYQAKVHPGQSWEEIAAETPTELYQTKPPRDPVLIAQRDGEGGPMLKTKWDKFEKEVSHKLGEQHPTSEEFQAAMDEAQAHARSNPMNYADTAAWDAAHPEGVSGWHLEQNRLNRATGEMTGGMLDFKRASGTMQRALKELFGVSVPQKEIQAALETVDQKVRAWLDARGETSMNDIPKDEQPIKSVMVLKELGFTKALGKPIDELMRPVGAEILAGKVPAPPAATDIAAADGFDKLAKAVANNVEPPFRAEADVKIQTALEDQMANERASGVTIDPGTEVYRKLQDAGVYVTDTTTPGGWADVPSDLAPGTRVARGGFDVNSDIGTVVMMDPKDITLGNDGLWEKMQALEGVDPATFENIPVLDRMDGQNIATEGNHRVFLARQHGEAKLKVALFDGETKVSDIIDTSPTAEQITGETAAGIERKVEDLQGPTETDWKQQRAHLEGSGIAKSDADNVIRVLQKKGMNPQDAQSVLDRSVTLFSEGAPDAKKVAAFRKLSAAARRGWFNKAADELAPSEAAGITSHKTVAEEQAAQDAFAAHLAAKTQPAATEPAQAPATEPAQAPATEPAQNAAAPVAAPGGGAAEVPPVAPPPAPPGGMGPGWSPQMEEAFANDFERWFYKGINPEQHGLLPAFRIIGQQVTDLWRKMRGFITDTATVPPEAAKVFDTYVGDVWSQMKTYGDEPVPAALVRGRRRMRTIASAPDASQQWGDGREVKQLPAPDGTLTVQNLQERAVMAADTTVPALHKIFGKAVETTLKPMKSLIARMDEGSRVMDALRSRVIVGDWREVDAGIQQLADGGFQVLGVEDTRRVPATGGQRGVRAFVVDPAHPDLVQEVEFVTPLGKAHRDATYAHDQALSKLERDTAVEEQKVARLSMSDNPNQAGVAQSLADHQKALEALAAQRDAGRRYMEGYYEPIADQIASDFGEAVPRSPFRQAMDGFRLFVAKHSERQLFETGYADFQYLFERAYLPLKIRSAPDENVLSIMEGTSTEAKSATVLDDERAVQGLPQPIYFPHVEQPDHFSYITPKGRGMRKLSENPNLKASTGKLFAEGGYVTDPFQAYSIRAARAVKMRDAFGIVQDVTQRYGRKVTDPNAILPGERLFAPDFETAIYRARVGIDDRIGALLSKLDTTDLRGALDELSAKTGRALAPDIVSEGILHTMPIEERQAGALYLAVSEAMPEAQREILALTHRGLDLYAVPEKVMANLEHNLKRMGVNNFTVAWDSYTHLWRSLALYGSPRWVLNNFFGNLAMSMLEGVKLRDVYHAATDRTNRWYLHELTNMTGRANEIDYGGWFSQTDLYPNELLGRGASTDVGRAERYAFANIQKSPIARPFRWWKDLVKGFNTDMESLNREVGFATGARKALTNDYMDLPLMRKSLQSMWTTKEAMQRMLTDGITPATYESGMNMMGRTFGDFASLSPFERNVVRRYFVPFYPFYKHVGKMLIRAPFEHPFKAQLAYQLAQEEQAIRAQWGPLPEWTDQMVPFGSIGPDGKMPFLSTAGPNPFNAFADLGLSSLHPLIQAGVEMVTGRDTFTGQQFTSPDVITPYGSDQRFKITRDANGMPVDAVPIGKVTPSLGEELLQQMPWYNQIRQVAAGGRPYDTEGIIGSINNPQTGSSGQPLSPYNVGGLAAQQLGYNVHSYDVAGFQQQLEAQRQAALNEALKQWQAGQAA